MFDADKAKRLLLRWEEDPTSEPDRIDEMVAELASACAEIERLRARVERQAEWLKWPQHGSGLHEECECLRKLVGEACDLARDYVEHTLEMPRREADERLAAIRRDAGLEGE